MFKITFLNLTLFIRLLCKPLIYVIRKYPFQGKQVELNECDNHSQKPSELDNELDNMTFHSETVESRSEHGSAIGN
jgi:hypothetical protein